MNPEWIGGLAAFLTTCSFLPQAVKVIRRRDTRSISLAMYAMFSAGVALWLAYGWMTGSWPIIAANAVTLCLSLAILGMKIRLG